MFKYLKARLRKRAWGSNVMLQAGKILSELLDSQKAEDEIRGIRGIKKWGDEKVQEFWEHAIKMVLEIVQDPNPVVAMRRKLIQNIRMEGLYRNLWTEEFYEHREAVYESWRELAQKDRSFELPVTDEETATWAIWLDAESAFLRCVQMEVFKEDFESDWWTPYVKMYDQHVQMLYRYVAAKKDGKDPGAVNDVLIKLSTDALKDCESNLLGNDK